MEEREEWRQGGLMGGSRNPVGTYGGLNQMIILGNGPKWADS